MRVGKMIVFKNFLSKLLLFSLALAFLSSALVSVFYKSTVTKDLTAATECSQKSISDSSKANVLNLHTEKADAFNSNTEKTNDSDALGIALVFGSVSIITLTLLIIAIKLEKKEEANI